MVAVAWIGYDQPRSLGAHEFGSTLTVPERELVPPAGVSPQGSHWVYDPPVSAEPSAETSPP